MRRGVRENCRNTSIADLTHHVLFFMWVSGIELRCQACAGGSFSC